MFEKFISFYVQFWHRPFIKVLAHKIWRRNKKKFVKKSFSLANIEPKRVLNDFTPKNQLLIEKVFFSTVKSKNFFPKSCYSDHFRHFCQKNFHLREKKFFSIFFSLVPQAKKKFFFKKNFFL